MRWMVPVVGLVLGLLGLLIVPVSYSSQPWNLPHTFSLLSCSLAAVFFVHRTWMWPSLLAVAATIAIYVLDPWRAAGMEPQVALDLLAEMFVFGFEPYWLCWTVEGIVYLSFGVLWCKLRQWLVHGSGSGDDALREMKSRLVAVVLWPWDAAGFWLRSVVVAVHRR